VRRTKTAESIRLKSGPLTIDLALYEVGDVTSGLEEGVRKDGRASQVRVLEALVEAFLVKRCSVYPSNHYLPDRIMNNAELNVFYKCLYC
jgi:hypothetical protein